LENPKVKAYDTARLGVKRVRKNPCRAGDSEAMGTVWERNRHAVMRSGGS